MASIEINGFAFPERIDSFAIGELVDYEKINRGAGYSIPYNSGNIAATVYIYDKQLKSIPKGPRNEIVADEFSKSVRVTAYYITEQDHHEIADFKKYELNSPRTGIEFVCAEITVKAGRLEYRTDLYMTGSKGYFVKIRITYPVGTVDFHSSHDFAEKIAKIIYD